MLTKRTGGLTEFIPSPSEKRDGLIHNHVLELVSLLHERLSLVEETLNIVPEAAKRCSHLITRIQSEEAHIHEINHELLSMAQNDESGHLL